MHAFVRVCGCCVCVSGCCVCVCLCVLYFEVNGFH